MQIDPAQNNFNPINNNQNNKKNQNDMDMILMNIINNKQMDNMNNYNNLVDELNKYKDENIKLKEKINSLEEENKKLNNNLQNANQNLINSNIMVVHFISGDGTINQDIECLPTDTFAQVEEKFYQIYDNYRDNINNTFLANGIVIKRFRTMSENNIKSGDKIQLQNINE